MVATSRYRRSVPALSLWLAVLAVFYLTIGVHLLHPLFHPSHAECGRHELSYQQSEAHHHSPCPVHDYCQTIHHLDLADVELAVSLFPLVTPYIQPCHQRIQQHCNSTCSARAPPIA